MDLPFLFSQRPIFRAYNLTADLNMRHVADIHIVSVKLRYLCFSQCIGNMVIGVGVRFPCATRLGNMVIAWYLENSLFDQHLLTLHFPYLVSDNLLLSF
jgi:hypothetical protein